MSQSVLQPRWLRASLVGFYLATAVAVIAWWVLLWTVPASGGWFVPADWATVVLPRFATADLLLLAGGSIMVMLLVACRRSARLAAAVVSGGWCYATLVCLHAACVAPGGWFGTALMASTGLCNLSALSTLNDDGSVTLFRPSIERPTLANWLWSLVQVVLTWVLFLAVWPIAIVEIERRLELPRLPGWCGWLGVVVFALASLLNMATLRVMIGLGGGTPVPTSCPRRLVVRGPYRFVRNPMALAGLSQGVGVCLWFWSPMGLVYCVLGGVLWHLFMRPPEEANLLARFGTDYAAYRRRVPLWLPIRVGSTVP